ncbi:MAG TPA: dethiobiotin synthase [Rhizomicrobium sp.]|nr:dethiobiotin synthase [Rhizomicrobium sp.]
MTAFFVTATGTDIGKTFVAAGLIRHLRSHNKKVTALKPIVSGFDLATAALSDPGMLLEALDEPIVPEALDRISPWRFAAPLSPDMAAEHEGKSVDYEAVLTFCRDAIAANDGTLLIEGVGGVMVPLDHRHTVLDWMTALGLPLIVVTGSYLGTISHTLTALDVLARRNLRVAGLVVNESPTDIPIAQTMAAIRRFAPNVPIASLSRHKRPTDGAAELATVWRMLSRSCE